MKVITIDFLGCEIGLFTKREKLIKCAESLGINDIAETVSDIATNGVSIKSCGADGFPYFFIGVFNGSMATLVHEVSHTVDWLLDRYGIPNNLENTELRAYLTDYIFSEAMRLAKFKRVEK